MQGNDYCLTNAWTNVILYCNKIVYRKINTFNLSTNIHHLSISNPLKIYYFLLNKTILRSITFILWNSIALETAVMTIKLIWIPSTFPKWIVGIVFCIQLQWILKIPFFPTKMFLSSWELQQFGEVWINYIESNHKQNMLFLVLKTQTSAVW